LADKVVTLEAPLSLAVRAAQELSLAEPAAMPVAAELVAPAVP